MSETYIYHCPTCRKKVRTDDPAEPCCTGPSESRHEHEMVVMRLLCVENRQTNPIIIDPHYAEQRTTKPLILPGMLDFKI